MRRPALAVALTALVLLAGCVGPLADGGGDGTADSTTAPPEDETTDPSTPAPETEPSQQTQTPGPAPGDDGSGDPPATEQPDPAEDRLGWEAGYWYNDPLAVDNSDGLNESERTAVIGRAMARVELVRGLEFQDEVNVSVVGRDEFDAGDIGGDPGGALRTFDNAKFEAMLLVGSDDDSIDTQEGALNTSVGGYYSPDEGAIVLVSDSATPTFDSERTLAHELVHALQDQHFENFSATDDVERTRDSYNGRNGLVEGDANAVQYDYMSRCGEQWRCVSSDSAGPGGGGGADLHMGIYLLEYFPYADGPVLIDHLREEGGWELVNEAYGGIPTTATEVIYPERYGSFEPEAVDLEDDLRGGWERVRPPNRPDHGRIGQSGLATTFAYTIFDEYNRTSVVAQNRFVNAGLLGGLDEQDPLNYDLEPTQGWVGDRFHAYERDGETAYVWRLAWESPADAERFASGYRQLLSHWGGERVDGDTWRVAEDSPFTGAIHLDVDGDTVTVAKAPTTGGLGEVYAGAR